VSLFGFPRASQLTNNINRARLAALYSDFRQLKATNPDGYAANVEAWREGLAHAARAGVLPSSDALLININEELIRNLESKEWGRPLALATVVQESIQRKHIVPAKEFEESRESIYHNPWSLNLLNLLGWGLRQLGVASGFNQRIATGRFIVLQNLEDAGKELIKRTERKRGRVERIYSRQQFAEFRTFLQPSELSDRDMDLLLRYLQRDKGYLVYDSQTVKLISPGETASITQEDSTIASLKSLIQDLKDQTKVLEKKVDELGITAREAVSRKNKVSALAALRSKNLTESTLSKRHATLSQLEEIFLKIEQASDQVELVRVMESSAKVLGKLNKEVGGVERVDEVLDDLREQMGQVDEVGNIIAEVSQGGAVDEGEVDDELEQMENEERKKVEDREKKEREEREVRERGETRRKLAELEEIERRATEEATRVAREKETGRDNRIEEVGLEESVEGLKRMSLDPPEHATT
jgi:charged multivesicular body protein 7